MAGYRGWDVPAGQSPMPGLLLRCDCLAFVLAQETDEEPGIYAYRVLDTGRHRPFDGEDLDRAEAFVSAWRQGKSKPLW